MRRHQTGLLAVLCAFFPNVVFSISYLRRFRAELLAPTEGASDFLWVGFETSSASQFQTSLYQAVSLTEIGQPGNPRLLFPDCTGVAELAPSWPRLVRCYGGIFELDGPLQPSAWYEMVLKVWVLPGNVAPRLYLQVGEMAKVPAAWSEDITFFENAPIDVSPEENTYPIGPMLTQGGPDAGQVEAFGVEWPQTFVPVDSTLRARLSLRAAGATPGLPGNVLLIFARPFTLWSLQPDGVLPTVISGRDPSATCMNELAGEGLEAVAECYWVSFGADRNGARLHAAGLKLVLHNATAVPSVLELVLRTPPIGSFAPWVAVTLGSSAVEADGGSGGGAGAPAAARLPAISGPGISVTPAPDATVLSYSSRATAARNIVQLQVVPGATVYGSEGDESLMGHIKFYLPPDVGEVVACEMEPIDVWAVLAPGYARYRARTGVAERSCTFLASSTHLHFFDRTVYTFRIEYFNPPAESSGEETWRLEIRNAGPLASPAGTAHSFVLPQTFSVANPFPLFRVVLTRLAVSARPSSGPRAGATVTLQMATRPTGASLLAAGPLACLRLQLPDDFSFGATSSCNKFQVLSGFPQAASCALASHRDLRLTLPEGSSMMDGQLLAFAVQLWNPSALLALRGHDVAPWLVEAWHGYTCSGRLHAAREGQSSASGEWPHSMYPLMASLLTIAASTRAVGSRALVSIIFRLPTPVEPGSFLLVSAPEGFSWAAEDRHSVVTDTGLTGTVAWALWSFNDPPPVSLGDGLNELLLTVGGSGLAAIVKYSFQATVSHPRVGSQSSGYSTASLEGTQWWTLEAFQTVDGSRPPLGFRQNMTGSMPFHKRIAAASASGYALQLLGACEVLPWDNRLRQITPVLLRFTPSVSVDWSVEQPPVLRVLPPESFAFRSPCEARAPLPLHTSGLLLAREALEVAQCLHDTLDRQVWLVMRRPVVAATPYVVEVQYLEMPVVVANPYTNFWSLSLARLVLDDLTSLGSEAAQGVDAQGCEGVSGFPSALPLPRAELQLGSTTSFRPQTMSEVSFLFSVPEPSFVDYSLTILGPVGAAFGEDCLASLRHTAVPMASAMLPGRIIWCLGGGGGPDRARAELEAVGAGGGGLLPGEVYGFTMAVRNGMFLSGLPATSNNWRLRVSDPAWYFHEAVAAGLPSYDLAQPITLDFLVSDKVSTDPHTLLGPRYANLTVRFSLPEATAGNVELVLYAPPDSFELLDPCRLSHTDQLDWVPIVEPLPPGAQPAKQFSMLSPRVFTSTCRPSCVSLSAELVGCQIVGRTLNATILEPLQASTPYCFAIAVRSPSGSGAGYWRVEVRRDGVVLDATEPTLGPVAGALHTPRAEHGIPFTVTPSTRSRYALHVTLDVAFSLPIDLQGHVTLISPVTAGTTTETGSGDSSTASEDLLALPKGTGTGRTGVPFFDLSDACSQQTVTAWDMLPAGVGCVASSRAVSLGTGRWQSYTHYAIRIENVPAGAITGASLMADERTPDFVLAAVAEDGSTPAMGRADGWLWVPELQVLRMALVRPLLEATSPSPLELQLVTATAIEGHLARLVVQPPRHFQFQLLLGPTRARPDGAGDGPLCEMPEGQGVEPCYAIKCRVEMVGEDGLQIELPVCSRAPGCCYSTGQPGAPAFAQLLAEGSAATLVLPPASRLSLVFEEVRPSGDTMDIGEAAVASVGEWRVATELLSCSNVSSIVIQRSLQGQETTNISDSGSHLNDLNGSSTLTTTTTGTTTATTPLPTETTTTPATTTTTVMTTTTITISSTTTPATTTTTTLVPTTTAPLPTPSPTQSPPSPSPPPVPSTTAVPPNSLQDACASSAEGGDAVNPRYRVLDEAQAQLVELYLGFVRAMVQPSIRTASYDKNPVTLIFELPSVLPRFDAALRVVAPAGFSFVSNITAVGETSLALLRASLGGREVLHLPDGFVLERNGPVLEVRLHPSLGGSLQALVVYAFSVQVDNPHVRPPHDESGWRLETMVAGRTIHWGEALGFEVRGSLPQLQVSPSSSLPLFPRNILDITFILSTSLPRAAPANVGSGAEPAPTMGEAAEDSYARATRVILVAPEGYIFPSNCAAPELAEDDGIQALSGQATGQASGLSLVSMQALPPPSICRGVSRGARSNATLLLLPEGGRSSGQLVQDQVYHVRLLVRNPLYGPPVHWNHWQLLTQWSTRPGLLLTMHDGQVEGFQLQGLQLAVKPGSVEPNAFHLSNISFTPRPHGAQSLAGSSRLSSLVLVAPRGTELSCVGLQVGSFAGPATSPERVSCLERDTSFSEGQCDDRGIDLPVGLWRLCLSFPRQPYWEDVAGATRLSSTNDGMVNATVSDSTTTTTTTSVLVAQSMLWFAVYVLNPAYLPMDNTWALLALSSTAAGNATLDHVDRILDSGGAPGYQLIERQTS